MEIRELLGKKVTVKIKGDDGYYYNDMTNEKFNKVDVAYYEDFCKNADLYSIEYCNINNVYIVEIHE